MIPVAVTAAITQGLNVARGLWTAAQGTRVGSFLIGTPVRALLTGLGVGSWLGSRSAAANQVQRYRG